MRITALAAVAMLARAAAFADPSISNPGLLDDPRVVRAMQSVWMESSYGALNVEAAFRLDGSPSRYRIVAAPPTNAAQQQTVPIIAGATFAVCHVHPTRTRPEPSQADRSIADRFHLKIYTIHVRGLYEYDPVTRRTTRLRGGVDWMARAAR